MSLGLSILLLASGLQNPPARTDSLTGRIEVHEVPSQVLGKVRTVRVWLPPGYEENPRRRYPVLFMGDGQNCFSGLTSYVPNEEWRADEAAQSLIEAGLVEPLIIAAVDNGGADRGNEYLPIEISMRAGEKFGGRAPVFARFLAEEVRPWLAKTYRVDLKPERTGFAGSSFGGVFALHLAQSRRDVWRRFGVFSPSLWVGNGEMIRRTKTADLSGFRMWMDMGTREGEGAADQLRELGRAVQARGLRPGRDMAVLVSGYAGHNERAWAERFGEFLMFAYPARR